MLHQELLDSALNQLAAVHARQQDRWQHIERELNPCLVPATCSPFHSLAIRETRNIQHVSHMQLK